MFYQQMQKRVQMHLKFLDLHDTVLEFGLTPNRSDALSMLGVAYEVGAILSEDMKYPEITAIQHHEKQLKTSIKLRVEAIEANPMYVAKVVKNVKIGRITIMVTKSS